MKKLFTISVLLCLPLFIGVKAQAQIPKPRIPCPSCNQKPQITLQSIVESLKNDMGFLGKLAALIVRDHGEQLRGEPGPEGSRGPAGLGIEVASCIYKHKGRSRNMLQENENMFLDDGIMDGAVAVFCEENQYLQNGGCLATTGLKWSAPTTRLQRQEEVPLFYLSNRLEAGQGEDLLPGNPLLGGGWSCGAMTNANRLYVEAWAICCPLNG